MKNKILIILSVIVWCTLPIRAERINARSSTVTASFPIIVSSPDQHLHIQLRCQRDGTLLYAFTADSKTLITDSKFGISGIGKSMLNRLSRRAVRSIWKPLWGKRAIVPDRYNELSLDMKSYKIIIRAYNEGIAFKYDFAKQKAANDLTEFNFNGNYTAWYYNGERQISARRNYRIVIRSAYR